MKTESIKLTEDCIQKIREDISQQVKQRVDSELLDFWREVDPVRARDFTEDNVFDGDDTPGFSFGIRIMGDIEYLINEAINDFMNYVPKDRIKDKDTSYELDKESIQELKNLSRSIYIKEVADGIDDYSNKQNHAFQREQFSQFRAQSSYPKVTEYLERQYQRNQQEALKKQKQAAQSRKLKPLKMVMPKEQYLNHDVVDEVMKKLYEMQKRALKHTKPLEMHSADAQKRQQKQLSIGKAMQRIESLSPDITSRQCANILWDLKEDGAIKGLSTHIPRVCEQLTQKVWEGQTHAQGEPDPSLEKAEPIPG